MPNVTVGERFIVESWCKSREQYALNARYYELTQLDTPGPVTIEELLASVDLLFQDLYLPVLSTESLYYGTRITRTHPSADGPYSVVASRLGVVGTQPLPPQVAVLIRMDTGMLGRRNKGRNYIPFVPTSFYGATGYLTSLGVVRYNRFVQIVTFGLGGDVGGGSFTMRQIVRVSSSAAGRLYVNAKLATAFATMRSRSRLYGPDEVPFI